MADTRIRIVIEGEDRNARRVITGVGDALANMGSQARGVGGSLQRVFEFAGGQLVADGIRNIASSLIDLGSQALDSYASFERLTMSLETFSARELLNAGAASNMQEAIAMSGERAQELLGWIEKLAVESPFQTQDIASAFRLAQAYGFTSDQAMRLTQATVDFAAGAGISGPMMDRISLALGQIQARGKVSAQELNQLSEAGINARQILATAFGVGTAEITAMIEKGLVPANLAVEAITQSLEQDFGGAAKRQANTFSGLISSLSDLKTIGLREFFAGTFQTIQPLLVNFVSTVTNPAIKAEIRAWGDALGQQVAGGVQRVSEAIGAFRSGGLTGLAQALQVPPLVIAGLNFAAQNTNLLKGAVLGLAGVLAASAVATGLSAVGGALLALASPMGLITLGAMALGVAWTTNFGNIQGITAQVWATIQPIFAQFGAWVQTTLPAAFAALAPPVTAAWTTVSTAVSTAWGSIQPVLTQLWSWMQVVLPLSMAGIGASASTAWAGFSTAITTAWATAQGVFTQIPTAIAGVATTLSTVFGPSITRLGQSITGAFAGLGTLGPQFTGLQLAIGNMVTAAQPLLTALGQSMAAVFGLTSLVTINFFSTMFQNLPAIVGVAIDQLTLTFNTIATTLTSVVGIVGGLLTGDFAGAWESTKTLVGGAVTFMTGSLANLSLTAGLLLGSLKTFIATTFTDIAGAIGLDAINTQLASVRQTITDFFTGPGNVFSAAFSVIVDTPAWLDTLTAWVWPTLTELTAWVWPTLPTFTWPDYSTWTWPDLPAFTWPDYSAWAWPDYNVFAWPDFPTPQWVTDLMNWSPVVSVTSTVSNAASSVGNAVSSFFGVDEQASGTSSFKGGLTWVDEKGPELFRFPNGEWAMGSDQGAHLMNLPAGTQIYSHEDAQKMMGMAGLTPIGANAGGTTSAPAVWPGGGSTFGDLSQAPLLAGKYIAQGGATAGKHITSAMKKATSELKSSLQGVEGLFNTSKVTSDQMKLAELGVPQNFADDYLRRLTDEVLNGKNWDNVSIEEAAARAGIDPTLPGKVILEMFTQKWNDSSLFADKGNLDLINMDAVKEQLAQQAAAKAGEQNIFALFGIQPEQAQGQAVALGGMINTGVAQGLAAGTGAQNIGTQFVNGMAAGITPETLAPVATQITSGIVGSMSQSSKEGEQGGVDIGLQIANAVVAQLTDSDALTGVGQTILQKIVDSWSTVGNIDIAAKMAGAMNLNLGTADAIQILQDIGRRIFKYVFQGYDAAATAADYVAPVQSGVNNAQSAAGGSAGTTTTTTATTPTVTAAPPAQPATAQASGARSSTPALAAEGGITIHNTFTVASHLDIVDVAYQVADIIQRRGRR